MSFMPHQIYSEDDNYSLRVIWNNNNCHFLKNIYIFLNNIIFLFLKINILYGQFKKKKLKIMFHGWLVFGNAM